MTDLIDRLRAEYPHQALADEAAAEIARLNQCLQWEQHRTGRQGTHHPECHTWGHQHYECLLGKYEALEQNAMRYRKLREDGVGGIRDDHGYLCAHELDTYVDALPEVKP